MARPPKRRPDPRDRLRDKQSKAEPQPDDGNEPDEDELADELAYLMGQREVSDWE